MTDISGQYAIVGIGETALGSLPHRTTLDLHLDAMRKAIADAGLTPAEVDGLLTNQPLHDPFRSYAAYLGSMAGLRMRFGSDLGMGGATPVGMAQAAVGAIATGLCETVVCVHARNNRSLSTVVKKGGGVRDGAEEFEEPFGMINAPAQYAAAAARHMYEYGTTAEQLGAIAIAQRQHAALNPSATLRKPLTLDEYLQSRFIVRPLRLLDCCLVSDGGGAFVVTTAARARQLPGKPVYVLGMGQHHPHVSLMDAPSLTTWGGVESAGRAYAMAGLSPSDMDFAQIYDCFTITVLITLEDYGFCAKGEGGAFVEDGRIAPGGAMPVNTHGGLLSQAHVEGMLHVTEAVRQLRGAAEPGRQVPDARVGIVSGNGGAFATHATLILGV